MFLILKNQYGKRLKTDIALPENSAYKNSFKILQFVHNNPQPSQKVPILGMHFSKHIIELKFLQLPPILYLPSFFFSRGRLWILQRDDVFILV